MAGHLPQFMCLRVCLLSSCRQKRIYRNRVAASAGFLEPNGAFDFCKNCVVFTHPDIVAWMPFRAALTNDDIARDYMLPAIFLHAKALLSESRPLRDEPPAFL